MAEDIGLAMGLAMVLRKIICTCLFPGFGRLTPHTPPGQNHDPSFIDWYFFALEFQDEDLLAYPWVCGVDSNSFLKSFLEQHVGRVLREGLGIKLGIRGHISDIYSLHERAVCFVVQVRSTDSSSLHHHGTQCEDSTRQVTGRKWMKPPHKTGSGRIRHDMERWKYK